MRTAGLVAGANKKTSHKVKFFDWRQRRDLNPLPTV